ncbi:MAG: DUF4279 domain-containing protein [Acidobacteriota bacterium]
MENEIKVSFIVSGFDHEPEVITGLLKVDPTETWKIGEPMLPSPIRTHQENGWELASQLATTAGVGDQIGHLLGRLEPARDSFDSLGEAYREFSCVIFANDGVPEIHFSHDTLQRIVELGASIDVDLYCMEAKQEEQ